MFISVVVVNESFVVDMNWATPCGSETVVTQGNIACNAVTHSSVVIMSDQGEAIIQFNF